MLAGVFGFIRSSLTLPHHAESENVPKHVISTY